MAFQHCWQPCCQTLLKCQVKLQLQIQHVLVVSNHLVKQGIGEGCPLSSLDGGLVWYACQPAIKGCLEGVNTDTSESPQFLGDQVKQPGPLHLKGCLSGPLHSSGRYLGHWGRSYQQASPITLIEGEFVALYMFLGEFPDKDYLVPLPSSLLGVHAKS